MKEVKLRRFGNLLTVSGLGVIAFGVWNVLKMILVFVMQRDMIEAIFAEISADALIKYITIAIIAAIMLLDFLIRLFVGLSARAEGFGKKKGVAYIVFAVLLVLGSVSSLVLVFYDTDSLTKNPILQTAVSVILEITSMVATIELIVAAVTVKKIKSEIGEVK
ncbi:MAG: hypothetical protein IJT70_06785 [Clostridia bacterium]|nr:hypothetical protein [Clostridia bacterium]